MNVLVACEESQVVTLAFRKKAIKLLVVIYSLVPEGIQNII